MCPGANRETDSPKFTETISPKEGSPLACQSEDKNTQNKHQYLAQFISSSKCTLEQGIFIFPFILSNFILGKTFFLLFSKGAQPGMQSSAWSECLQNDHGTDIKMNDTAYLEITVSK